MHTRAPTITVCIQVFVCKDTGKSTQVNKWAAMASMTINLVALWQIFNPTQVQGWKKQQEKKSIKSLLLKKISKVKVMYKYNKYPKPTFSKALT